MTEERRQQQSLPKRACRLHNRCFPKKSISWSYHWTLAKNAEISGSKIPTDLSPSHRCRWLLRATSKLYPAARRRSSRAHCHRRARNHLGGKKSTNWEFKTQATENASVASSNAASIMQRGRLNPRGKMKTAGPARALKSTDPQNKKSASSCCF